MAPDGSCELRAVDCTMKTDCMLIGAVDRTTTLMTGECGVLRRSNEHARHPERRAAHAALGRHSVHRRYVLRQVAHHAGSAVHALFAPCTACSWVRTPLNATHATLEATCTCKMLLGSAVDSALCVHVVCDACEESEGIQSVVNIAFVRQGRQRWLLRMPAGIAGTDMGSSRSPPCRRAPWLQLQLYLGTCATVCT